MLRRTRTRKLALWSALPPYLGGKRRLCPLIFREVDRILPRARWNSMTFLDGCLCLGILSALAVNVLFGWWWADGLAALGIAGFATREGLEARQEAREIAGRHGA